jgi:hypothetical protein
MSEEKILPEELAAINQVKTEYSFLVTKLDNLKLQYENLLLKLMVKYSMSKEDSLEESTGLIKRKEEKDEG